jgi:hypothetical protein
MNVSERNIRLEVIRNFVLFLTVMLCVYFFIDSIKIILGAFQEKIYEGFASSLY